TFLYVNTLYIILFAEGSAVHLYRVFFFSGFFALATTDLVVEAAAGARRLVGRRSGVAAGVVVVAAYLLMEVPHAYANLLESRAMMGTHSQPGYNPEAEKLRFARAVHDRTPQDARLIVNYRQLSSR